MDADILDRRIRKAMPYPIARAWHGFHCSLNDAERVRWLLATYEVTLRTVISWLLPDYLRGARVEAVEATIETLKRPQRGHLVAAVRELTRALRGRSNLPSFTPDALTWWWSTADGQQSGPASHLEGIVALRNWDDHTAPPPLNSSEWSELRIAFETPLRQMLDSLEWMTRYRLLRVLQSSNEHSVEVRRQIVRAEVKFLMGTEPDPVLERVELATAPPDRPQDRVYLVAPNGREFLLLSPFVSWNAASPLRQSARPGRGPKALEALRECCLLFKSFNAKMTHLHAHDDAFGLSATIDLGAGVESFDAWRTTPGRPDELVVTSAWQRGLAWAERERSATTVVHDERYEILDVLGAGRASIVYRARDRRFQNAEVALKAMTAGLSTDPNFRERFDQEIEVLRRLDHPRVVKVLDRGRLPDGRHYYTMPILHGATLREVLSPEGVEEWKVLTWGLQLLSALAYIHSKDVVHRDVCPGNCLLDRDGAACLADFGLARVAGRGLTSVGVTPRSSEYAAPESRNPGASVDPPSDVFSLAVMLHELLLGVRPNAQPGVGAPGAFGALLRWMGATSPENRPTAVDACSELQRIIKAAPALTPSYGPVAGRYEIRGFAAAGGMGAVYRAIDRETGNVVALKIVDSRGGEHERFEREARLLAEQQHPCIVRYYAHGTTASGEHFIVTEWLDGEDLESRLRRGPLAVDEAVCVAEQVASALAVAHQRGVIHRDIKPANLFLREGDIARVVVLDFGIARPTNALAGPTRTGAIVGTPGYIAPEQLVGGHDLDSRVDVFALGCVMFECLTGRPAFPSGVQLAQHAKIAAERNPHVRELRSEVPGAIDALVASMLSKQRDHRPPDASAVLEALTGRAATPLSTSSGRASLTGGERRLHCILLIGNAEHEGNFGSATLAGGRADVAPDELRRIVEVERGHFDPLPGGAAVVTLSGEGEATDLAARAARCALAVRDARPNSMMALATMRGELTAQTSLGDLIDRAASLLTLPNPPNVHTTPIRLDEVTAGLLDVSFDVQGDTVGLFLCGKRELVQGSRTLLGQVTSCVGRERDLHWLEGIFLECRTDLVSNAVLVIAPPGGGKSRLVREWLSRQRAEGEPLEVLIAQGDQFNAGSPFGMIAPSIRRLAGVLDGEPIAVRRRKLLARLGRYLEGEELTSVAEFLGELTGIPLSDAPSEKLRAARLDARLMGDQMERAFVRWLEVESAKVPIVWVLEDFHWGDRASVNFLDAALRRLRDRPFLVLALGRPEVLDVFPSLWPDHPRIVLKPLVRSASERLVREVLGATVDKAQVDLLVTRANGNPFFLEELIRTAASGLREGVPESVLAATQTRLEKLAPDARLVLRAASVFGRFFWRNGVAALSASEGDQTEGVDRWLGELERLELIEERPSARFGREREYAFRHDFVREAAYAMLTDGDRVLGHRLAGAWLERVGERDPVALAEHFSRGAEPGRAVQWFLRAAAQALGGNDLDAALAHVDRGISCGASGETLGALLLCRVDALRWRGRFTDAASAAEAAVRAAPEGCATWYGAVAELANDSHRAGDPAKITAQLSKLATALERRPPSTELVGSWAIAFALVAMHFYHQGQRDTADIMAARLDALTQEVVARDSMVKARVLQTRTFRAFYENRIDEYIDCLREAQAAFERAGDQRNACMQQARVGQGYFDFGRYDEAEAQLRGALVKAECEGWHRVMPSAQQGLGQLLAYRGQFEEAIHHARAAVNGFRGQEYSKMEAVARGYLASVLLAAGRFDDAIAEARTAVTSAGASARSRSHALAVWGQAQHAQGDPEAGLKTVRRAWEGVGDLGDAGWVEQTARLAAAEALHALGHKAEAKHEIVIARDNLLERVEQIALPEVRAALLENVPENVRILKCARDWLNEESS